MKVSGVLAGLLLLFVPIHGFDDLSVQCSEFWLLVRLRRVPFVNQLPPQSFEFYLGTGCPVNRVLPDFFEFAYTVTTCGIRKYDRPWGTLIESSITYEPVVLNIRGYAPISCIVPRKFSFTFSRYEVDSNSSDSEETTQHPVETKDSTSQVENLETLPGTSGGTCFSLEPSHFYCLVGSGEIKLQIPVVKTSLPSWYSSHPRSAPP